MVLYSAADMTVSTPAYKAAVTNSLATLPAAQVASAQTYWSTGSAQFAGANGHETFALLQLRGADDAAKIKSFDAISAKLSAPGLTVRAGGQIPTEAAINKQVTSDIGRAEGISMPVLLLLLLVIFGSLAAASLPLAIGGIGILGSFAALRLLTLERPPCPSTRSTSPRSSASAWRSTTGCSWWAGSARNSAGQPSVEDALARTLATAGRTVAVSGITVATALASLLALP